LASWRVGYSFYNLSSMLTQCVFPSPEITKQFLITVL
jgi:hypothetical protein